MAQPKRQHRRPGEPVAPDRQGRDQLGIAQPGRRAIDRGAARLVAEHPRHFGIGEALQEAHDHRDHPDQEGQLARRPRDAADREQHQRRHTCRDPEGALPVQRPDQLARAGFIRICPSPFCSTAIPGSRRSRSLCTQAESPSTRATLLGCTATSGPAPTRNWHGQAPLVSPLPARCKGPEATGRRKRQPKRASARRMGDLWPSAG